MIEQEVIFRIIEIGLQFFLVVFAGKALFVWKKEFNLKHFELHEEILNEIKNIFNYEEDSYYFSLSEQVIDKQMKNHSILSDSDYFEILEKERSEFLPQEYVLPQYDMKPLIEKLIKLIPRSNKKISENAKKIIRIYNEGIDNLNFEVEQLRDSYDQDLKGTTSEKEEKYIEYLSNQKKELIFLKMIKPIKILKKELDNFLINKK